MTRTKRFWRVLAIAAVMVPALGLAAPAQAADPPPEVRFVATSVIVRPNARNVAYVTGSYRCYGGQPIHLWVSVKQGGPDPTAEGSGATSTAWYDTNAIEPPPVICDGQWHAVFVPVGRHFNKGQLQAGAAWVQFCLVAPGGDFGIVASNSKWVNVVGV
ncbi:MAG TPA: hypothetical protein VM121_09220 [Acidimicrobiales bacterium]|nr:hypothetical protein [Acidimicrobiales bacterium]